MRDWVVNCHPTSHHTETSLLRASQRLSSGASTATRRAPILVARPVVARVDQLRSARALVRASNTIKKKPNRFNLPYCNPINLIGSAPLLPTSRPIIDGLMEMDGCREVAPFRFTNPNAYVHACPMPALGAGASCSCSMLLAPRAHVVQTGFASHPRSDVATHLHSSPLLYANTVRRASEQVPVPETAFESYE